MTTPEPQGSDVPNFDTEALQRLVPYVLRAIAAQPVDVADQLLAAYQDGKTTLRFESSALAPVVIVSVAGYELAEVSLLNLTEG